MEAGGREVSGDGTAETLLDRERCHVRVGSGSGAGTMEKVNVSSAGSQVRV